MNYFQDLERGANSLIKTANSMGYMATDIDIYTDRFLSSCLKDRTYLEIGCSYGLVVLNMLERDCRIIANDIDEGHLAYLSNIVSSHFPTYKDRLQISVGRFPDSVALSPNSLDGVLAARVLHFLRGEEIELGLKNILSWLKPGGELYIISETPYKINLHSFIPIYEYRKARGEQWPGYLCDVHKYFSESADLPSFINFLDKDHISCVLQNIGYEVIEACNYERPIGLNHQYLNYPNFMAVIARKPS